MLILTDNAVEAVKDIVSSAEEIPDTGGLRVVAEAVPTGASLRLSVASVPAEDDQVVEEQGARVFLEPGAAELLDDKVLDASVGREQVAFTISDQA
jgi:Fe-S cluster assembly iron-binding protein IscA